MQVTVQLTVRPKSAKRAIPDPVRFDRGSSIDLATTRILLLVHGFANTEDQAHSAYEKFITGLMSESDSFPASWGAVCEFHWPGDYPGSSLMSYATYSERVPVAGFSGERLARFLHEDPAMTRDQELFIVAHSLGCRVVLEALREISLIKDYDGPVVREVALLAAAIPVEDCVLGSGEFQPLRDGREHVFYSPDDGTLHRAFELGQRAAGERGDAVGREGMPDPRWQSRFRTALDHSDYWGDRHFVAVGVSSILGFGPVPLPERFLPEARPGLAPPPQPRTLAERLLSWRR